VSEATLGGGLGQAALEMEIAETRTQLGEAIDELTRRLNLKVQAQTRLHEFEALAAEAAHNTLERLPPQVRGTLERFGEQARPAAEAALGQLRRHRNAVIAVAGVLTVTGLMVRRRHR